MKIFTTVLELLGLAAIITGAALIWIPAAFIVGGILAIGLSAFLTTNGKATK